MRVSRWLVSFSVLLSSPLSAHASLAPASDDIAVTGQTSGTRQKPSVTANGTGFIVVWEDATPDPNTDGIHVLGHGFDDQGTLVGTEFQVDGAGTQWSQAPSIVANADGELAVVWRSDPKNGERPSLLAQRIDGAGAKLGDQFQVNTPRTLDGDYYLGDPATAPVPDGGFVVVWSSGILQNAGGLYGPISEIYSRRFLSNGQPFAFDELVSEPGAAEFTHSEVRPDIAALGEGFMVTWAQGDYGAFGSSFKTVSRGLYPSGQPRDTEFDVSTAGAKSPRVAARQPAGFTVVWSTYEFVDYIPQAGGNVVARTFDAFDEPLAEPFQLSTPATGTDPMGDPRRARAGVEGLSAATGAAGDFVVVWTSGAQNLLAPYYGGSSDGDASGIFGRSFANDDQPSGGERQINAVGAGDQTEPDLAFSASGKLAVVWDAETNNDAAPDQIVARVFQTITPQCGDADENGNETASDALFVLQTAVGARSCAPCLCDVNGSGTPTAVDALMVLQTAVGSGTSFSCPPCEEPSVAFQLQSDAPCYGTRIEIPSDALPSNAVDRCKPDPALALLGCSTSVSDSNGSLVFDARGCFLNASNLFSCTVSGSEAASMAQASVTACGCGCADTCPSTPVVCAAGNEPPPCGTTRPAAVMNAADIRRAANATVTTFETQSTAQLTVTSSTTCGTCCDYYDSANIVAPPDPLLAEVVLRFHGGHSNECSSEVNCGFAPEVGGPTYERYLEDNDTVEVCISDPEGVSGLLGQCDVLVGDITRGPAEVVRALGVDLAPITPVPGVSIQSAF